MTTPEPPAQQHVVVSGLDGVLVNSEPATTRCAWQTASRLWPEVMEAAAEVPAQQAGVRRAWVNYDWTALTGEEDDGMPSWLSAKLRQLRPVVRDSGYEAVLLARLCAEEALAASRGSRGSRPLSVGEIEVGWADGLRAVLMARTRTRGSASSTTAPPPSLRRRPTRGFCPWGSTLRRTATRARASTRAPVLCHGCTR